MATSVRSLVDALTAIVGREALRDDAPARAAAAIDGVSPRVVVRPSSLEQVAGVIAFAHEERLSVCPRGSGSALGSGAPPARVDVVLDLATLDRVREFNPDDLTVSVECGVTLGALNETVLGPKRQMLPVDPPGWRARTIGGVIATNASGPLRARYGTMRDLLLGVRFVQADGVVTWGGARVVKSVTGYDVPKLMVGALGTIGVIVEATLRLHPAPETERTWLVEVRSLDTVQACLDRLIASPLEPNRVEILGGGALRALGLVDAGATLAVSFGSVAEAVREQGERLVAMAKQFGAAISERPIGVWREIERLATPTATDVTLEIASLPARLASTIGVLMRETKTLGGGVRMAVTGRATIGTLSAILSGAPPTAVALLVRRLRGVLAEFGGHVIARGGPREVRTAIDPWGPIESTTLELMRRLKAEFDPRGVLNPGRFVDGL